METWANRKWLILGRSEMIGLLKPHEYNACAEQAYRMHGEGLYDKDLKGHIVLDRPPRQREAMPPRHRGARDRPSTGDRRWKLSQCDAHGRGAGCLACRGHE